MAVTAGAGGVWARIPVEVRVIANAEEEGRGSGFPQLLITGRDEDPATGQIREGDPDQPALWQEASDYINNVWWLTLQSPEAAFAFQQRLSGCPGSCAERVSDEIIATAQAVQSTLSQSDAIGSPSRGLFLLALQQVVDAFLAGLLTDEAFVWLKETAPGRSDFGWE